MPGTETPMGLAFIICDQIIEDKLSSKKSIIGIFHRIHSSKFPCVHPSMSVFISLTGAQGEYPCELSCTSCENGENVFRAKGKVALQDPYQVVDMVFRLNGVKFDKPGDYNINFYIDDYPILMRRIQILELPKQEK